MKKTEDPTQCKLDLSQNWTDINTVAVFEIIQGILSVLTWNLLFWFFRAFSIDLQAFFGHLIIADVKNARQSFACYFFTYDRLSAEDGLNATDNLFQQEQLELLDQVEEYQNNAFGMGGFTNYFFSLFGSIEAIYSAIMIMTLKVDYN